MGLGLVYGPGAWLVRIKFVFSIIAELKGYLNHYPFPNLMFILFFILPFRQPWDVRSMHFHLLANHWLVGLHRVLSRNAERLVVVMVTLQVIMSSTYSVNMYMLSSLIVKGYFVEWLLR